ncbi:MAG: phosphate/phosphite/phosphonate ABC transporter substrate-binding protein [Gammaproteobacteria bacterium]|nr:phosphate/phosphite/phosphonate ABC transporter substrate-binding protein [Gammaproteobacteria bacterium]
MFTRFSIATLVCLITVISTPCNADAPAAAPKSPLTFGVVPQQAADKLAVAWKPLLDDLSEKTGRTIKFESATDIASFDKRTANGDFDLVYMNPMYYTEVHQSVGYQVFAKEKDTLLKGMLVVKKDSPYLKLEDLAGKTIVFPGPISFAATILPLLEFKAKNISISPVYIGSHEGVYNDVARGLHAAGGGVAKTLAQTDTVERNELRVLWSSDSYTPHPFAAHPRVERAVVEQIAKILFDLDQDERGKKILKELRFRGFAAAQDVEYEKLKTLSKQK